MNYYGRICLDDIKDEFLVKDSAGKRYVRININKRREPSKYGDTHYIKAYVPKEKYDMNKNYFIGEVKPREQKS